MAGLYGGGAGSVFEWVFILEKAFLVSDTIVEGFSVALLGFRVRKGFRLFKDR